MGDLIQLAHLAVLTVLPPSLYLPVGFLLPGAFLAGHSSTGGFTKLSSGLSPLPSSAGSTGCFQALSLAGNKIVPM